MNLSGGNPFYISTAIPYVNAPPHIGFAWELVLADAIARYQRARGRDVFFLTGTDDNSLKNVEAAESRGVPIRQLVDENAEEFFRLRDALDLSFDDFIRTSTDPRHFAAVGAIWNACLANGDIYEGEYEGLYCIGCEQFYASSELVDGFCPEHLRPPERVRERNWFFRLSRYRDDLRNLIRSGAVRVVPETRRSEILSFIESGLDDISISRSADRSRGWGLPVPGDTSQVIYVWFDALTNYISSLDYASSGGSFEKYWVQCPDRVHVIGKGILRFHAAYWPAMLLSAGIPLPTTMLVHGYLTTHGRKISKSLGAVEDPHELSANVGSDSLRYYLLSQFSPATDGDFSEENLRLAHDKDLADQLGNLVGRVASMIERYLGGRVPEFDHPGDSGCPLESVHSLLEDVDRNMDNYAVDRAVRRVWDVVREANRYVVDRQPWQLARHEDDVSQRQLRTVLYNLVEAIRITTAFAAPFIPSKSAEIAVAFSFGDEWDRLSERHVRWGASRPGSRIERISALFPKGQSIDAAS